MLCSRRIACDDAWIHVCVVCMQKETINVCVCVRVYIYITYIYIYICIYTYTYTCTYLHTYTYIHCIYIYTYISTHAHTHEHVCMSECSHVKCGRRSTRHTPRARCRDVPSGRYAYTPRLGSRLRVGSGELSLAALAVLAAAPLAAEGTGAPPSAELLCLLSPMHSSPMHIA